MPRWNYAGAESRLQEQPFALVIPPAAEMHGRRIGAEMQIVVFVGESLQQFARQAAVRASSVPEIAERHRHVRQRTVN